MKNWIEKEQLEEDILQSLKKDLKIDDFICTLLLQREVDSLKKAQNFFRPDINLLHDPFLMKDMKKVVEKIQNSRNEQQGLIINAGGYTHTSVAIHDALKILKIPIIELHISNIYNREDFRHKSLISRVAKGIICGFGVDGYIMALDAMKKYLK